MQRFLMKAKIFKITFIIFTMWHCVALFYSPFVMWVMSLNLSTDWLLLVTTFLILLFILFCFAGMFVNFLWRVSCPAVFTTDSMDLLKWYMCVCVCMYVYFLSLSGITRLCITKTFNTSRKSRLATNMFYSLIFHSQFK
jgi:hypothetical protein